MTLQVFIQNKGEYGLIQYLTFYLCISCIELIQFFLSHQLCQLIAMSLVKLNQAYINPYHTNRKFSSTFNAFPLVASTITFTSR